MLAGKCNEKIERRYLAEVIEPRLHDGVRLVVNAERAETLGLLAQARCLIMPIRWNEPFGMVMIEAMAAGVPVVGLRRGAVPELVRHGVTGWLADDPAELPDLLHRAGELDPQDCVGHVRAKFSASLMAQRYERIYRDALSGRASQPANTADARSAAASGPLIHPYPPSGTEIGCPGQSARDTRSRVPRFPPRPVSQRTTSSQGVLSAIRLNRRYVSAPS